MVYDIAINSTRTLSGYSEFIRKLFGALMILGALALALHVDIVLQQFAARYIPIIAVEDNEIVRKELQKMSIKNKGLHFGEVKRGAKAPDFVGITNWINSAPLTIEQLKGKVVLVDFWTYSCINSW